MDPSQLSHLRPQAGIPHHRAYGLLFGRPLAIDPRELPALYAAIERRDSITVTVVNALTDITPAQAAAKPTRRQMRQMAKRGGFDPTTGIYTLRVHDKLVQRGSAMDAESGITSYDSLDSELDFIESNTDVKGVFLWADSPGGQAAGMIQLGERVRGVAKSKPIVTWVDELAASAGYGIIAGASSIHAPETGEAGSIGVRWTHVSMVRAVEEMGLKVTEFTSGAKKLQGTPYADLSEDDIAAIQATIDTMAESFFKLVSRGRPATVKQIRGLEGAVLLAKDAKDAGLIDNIGTREDALADLIERMSSASSTSVGVSASRATPTAAPRKGASTEIDMNPILMTAVLGLPGCGELTAEALSTDEGARKASGAITTLKAQAGAHAAAAQEKGAEVERLAGQVEILTAAKAEAEKAQSDAEDKAEKLEAKVAAYEKADADAKAKAEEAAWAEALAPVKEGLRPRVRKEAEASRKDGQTAGDAVEALREDPIYGAAFEKAPLTAEQKKNLGEGGPTPNSRPQGQRSGGIRL